MDSVVSIGHGGQPSRKEWRAVTENSGRDNSGNQSRVGAATRPRTIPGASGRSSRNGRIFNSGGSGHSSDSDHLSGDAAGAHLMIGAGSPRDLIPHSMGQGNEAVLYEEMQLVQQPGDRSDTALNSMLMESGLGSMNNGDDALEEHILEVSRQREQLQSAELELRARKVAHAEIVRMQHSFDERAKQHSEFVANLQEQLQQRDEQIHQLEQQLEEREGQLRANQMETNEAVSQVWAKDGLLQQQTNELTTMRRERDNAVAEQKANAAKLDAERAEFGSQLEDVKEQMRQKELHSQELEEQHRNTQDLLIYKDEQLREAQAWMTRAQELDAYHVNTNNTLHAELRDRTDQLNNFWLGYQRQLADVERYHAQIVQRLQMELNEVREQNRILKGSTATDREDKKPPSQGDRTGALNSTDDGSGQTSKGLSGKSRPSTTENGSGERVQLPHIEAVPKIDLPSAQPLITGQMMSIAPGLPPSGPMAIHQFAIHQQGVVPALQPSPLQIPQVIGQLQPIPPMLPSKQHLTSAQHQQVLQNRHHHQPQVPASFQRHPSNHQSYVPSVPQSSAVQSQNVQQTLREQPSSENKMDGGVEGRSHKLDQHHPQSSDIQSQQQQHIQQMQGVPQGPPQVIQQKSSQPLVSRIQETGQSVVVEIDQEHGQELSSGQQENEEEQPMQDLLPVQQRHQVGGQEQQVHDQNRVMDEHHQLASYSHQQAKPNSPNQSLHHSIVDSQQLQHQQGIFSGIKHISGRLAPTPVSAPDQDASPRVNQLQALDHDSSQPAVPSVKEQATSSKTADPVLLDERSLLACLVRAVPGEVAGRIRISSTLPNRLGKMLAPLHWHDYRKQYGRLDEFVASHSELFVIDGDFIHLREGARASISATTAVARVAAAAAAVPVGQAQSPVLVTPVAQPQAQRGKSAKGSGSLQKVPKVGSEQDAVQLMNLSRTGTPSASPGSVKQYQGQSPRGPRANGKASHNHAADMVNLRLPKAEYGGKGDGGQRNTTVGTASRANGTGSFPTRGPVGSFENGSINGYGSPSGVYGRNGGVFANRQQIRKQNAQFRPALHSVAASPSAAH